MMELGSQKEGILLPHLGVSAASFGAFLTILNLETRSEILVLATEDFAWGIPMIITSYFLLGFKAKYILTDKLKEFINAFTLFLGHFLCLRGLYFCFKDVSELAGQKFKILIYFIIAIGLILVGFDFLYNFSFKKFIEDIKK